MVKRLSRKELYELVWSEPMKTLSARFGISDVALKKTCERAAIPTPDRGYWAKKEAGKSTPQVGLPERPVGMNDEVVVAGGSSYWDQTWSDEDLLAPLPPPPEFHEPIEAARERIAKIIGKLSVARDIRYAPFERRRLRILNTLFSAAARMNGKPTIDGREARSIHVTFHRQHVGIRLDRAKQHNRRGHAAANPSESNDSKLSFAILEGINSEKERVIWQDDETGKLEVRITDIAVELVLTAELQHRESAVRRYQWRVERKAELEEERRKRKVEAERAERERQRRLEQARIDRLLKDAVAFQQASEIRQYVQAIRIAHSFDEAFSTEALERWSQWALAQADRIDPAKSGAFLKSMRDEEDT
jgi:hypothetical protein